MTKAKNAERDRPVASLNVLSCGDEDTADLHHEGGDVIREFGDLDIEESRVLYVVKAARSSFAKGDVVQATEATGETYTLKVVARTPGRRVSRR